MNILHINTEKTWRGGEQQVLYLVKGLRERKHQSTIICQPHSPMSEMAMRDGFAVEEIKMRGGFDLLAIRRIARIMRKDYDIVHLHTANAHTLGVLASLLSGRRTKIVASRRVSFPIKNLFRRLKYNATDMVIAVSESVRQGLIDNGIPPEKVVSIHSSVDPGRFSGRKATSSDLIVGTIAHLAEHKGHKYLIEAAKVVLSAKPDVKFILAGNGEIRTELENQVTALGISENVIFLGFQSDVGKIINSCTITVLPSISGEGSPGVLKESMAAGIPVITTDIGGSTEIVDDGITGLVVPPMDSRALAFAITRLLTDEGLRKRIAEEGFRRVGEFTVDRMVERTELVYESLIAG